MFVTPIQEEVTMTAPLSVQERLQAAIEESGIKKIFIASKFGKTPSWLSKVLDGTVPLTEELLQRFEEILRTKI